MNKPRFQFWFLLAVFISLSSLLLAEEKVSVSSVVTAGAMRTPEFWIARQPAANQVILDAKGVQQFNQRLITQGLTKDLLDTKGFNPVNIRWEIQKELQKFERGDYFDQQGHKPVKKFFVRIKNQITLSDNIGLSLQYAFVANMTDQRLLPTDEILTAKPLDFEFDEIQNSSLDIGTPVLVIHETKDGQWVYTQTSSSAGWVKRENIVFCSLNTFRSQEVESVVVTSPKAPIYLDAKRKQLYGYVRMGARFPRVRMSSEKNFVIHIPSLEEKAKGKYPFRVAFLKKEDASEGFLSYTPATIINQAFKLLDAPYGWGGMNGEQDCSAFLQEVFGTVGIVLPRNSGEQAQAGNQLKVESLKFKGLEKTVAGITIAQMKGHIVLFLGMHEDRPYAIHEVYGYRESINGQDQLRVLNRVVISDFYLGKGSKKGSLLDRIVNIRELR